MDKLRYQDNLLPMFYFWNTLPPSTNKNNSILLSLVYFFVVVFFSSQKGALFMNNFRFLRRIFLFPPSCSRLSVPVDICFMAGFFCSLTRPRPSHLRETGRRRGNLNLCVSSRLTGENPSLPRKGSRRAHRDSHLPVLLWSDCCGQPVSQLPFPCDSISSLKEGRLTTMEVW